MKNEKRTNIIDSEKVRPTNPKATIDTSGFGPEQNPNNDQMTFDEVKIDEFRKLLSDLSRKGELSEDDKTKIASASLDLHKSTPLERGSIMDKSSIFSRFSKFEYKDKLSEVFNYASQISSSPDVLEEKLFEKWNSIGNMLKEYLRQKTQR
jgi:hypothetical protein